MEAFYNARKQKNMVHNLAVAGAVSMLCAARIGI
jgi:hypothetical protein